jgi:hypothetical protein
MQISVRINETAVTFPTGTAGVVVDTGGKFAEVGGLQISSAKTKICGLKQCFTVTKTLTCADLLQVWQFADF